MCPRLLEACADEGAARAFTYVLVRTSCGSDLAVAGNVDTKRRLANMQAVAALHQPAACGRRPGHGVLRVLHVLAIFQQPVPGGQ